MYIGTGCFHRRDALSGLKYDEKANKIHDWNDHQKHITDNGTDGLKESARMLEETSKILASCTYEQDTQWGKEVYFSTPYVLRLNLLHLIISSILPFEREIICRWD